MVSDTVPNPGSQKAQDAGCTCPIMDNGYGVWERREYPGWIYTVGCKLHDYSFGELYGAHGVEYQAREEA